MRQFKFIGFGKKESRYGDGIFTINKVYDIREIDLEDCSILVDDDEELTMWEELFAFEEVSHP